MQQENANQLAAYHFHNGTSDSAYQYLGCHRFSGEDGTHRYVFRAWAPRARRVDLVSDHTGWDEGVSLTPSGDGGIYEITITSPVSLDGMKYKFRIHSENGVRMKGDPYAFRSEGGERGASIVTDGGEYPWRDGLYMAERRRRYEAAVDEGVSEPLNIYEVHAASFLRKDGGYLSYRELAEELVGYLKYMGYTHVELMPLAEYPYDGSWGYQICGYYAPTSRFGSPEDLRYLVDRLHTAGIGVILDWVPAHFPKDEWGLYEFDGQPLYEYQEESRREARGWGTRYFDLGRAEVRSFLISNAVYWLREFHLDGLRVDAVASMLYLDYDRAVGEWTPNVYGDHRNLEAIAFLQQLNTAIDRCFPDALTIAEESTAYSGVTRAVSEGGLGFDLKWNMGWANDLFQYLSVDPLYRRHHHRALTFPMMYAYSERFVLPVSHDEVVHGKRSLIDKIAGNYEQKFAQMRATLMYMMSFPGRKLLFMGTELGQFAEWNADRSVEWFLLEYDTHRALRDFVRALNHFYLSHPPLYQLDDQPVGFSWLLADAADQNLIAYRRTDAAGRSIFAVISFSGAPQEVRLPLEGDRYTVLFDADGHMTGKELRAMGDGLHRLLTLYLPPFGACYFEETRDEPPYLI